MDKLNIPKIIKVGYQNRGNTYTGKLAYVIYIDEKGKVRKETSWNTWRDDKIDPNDFDNEPTEGFVLNKSGGGTRECYSWNPRNEFIRVYDPRGFEFEISLANLLFILQECTSSKGKGLEGEFVYGWDGTSLVLIPTCCKEYKESLEFTALKSKKIPRKEMVEGNTYQTKSREKLVFLGRHTIRNLPSYYYSNDLTQKQRLQKTPDVRKDIFYNPDEKEYVYLTGLNTIAEEIDSNTHMDYAKWFTEFMVSAEVAEFADVHLVPLDRKKLEEYSAIFLIEIKEGVYKPAKLTSYMYHKHSEYPVSLTLSEILDLDFRYSYRQFEMKKDTLNTKYKNNNLFTLEYRFKTGTTLKAHRYA